MVTVLLASFGVLASRSMSVQASWAVVVSAGTLLCALGMGNAGVLGSGLFYLVPSTLASGALFLLVDVVRRWRAGGTVVDEAPFLNAALQSEDINLDDEGEPLMTMPFPASTTLLALAFLACALLLAGLPPLPTFLGKAGMLSAAFRSLGEQSGARIWIFVAVLLLSGFVVLLALMRTGIRIFWTEDAQRERPRVRASEGVPLLVLLGITAALAVGAGPAMEFANDAAQSLFDRGSYIEAVLSAPVRRSPSAVSP
jgi:multicomponent K+:H+ antiporter subunit D